jgi:hypothetical protein
MQVLRVYPYSGIQLMSFDQFSRWVRRFTFGSLNKSTSLLPPPPLPRATADTRLALSMRKERPVFEDAAEAAAGGQARIRRRDDVKAYLTSSERLLAGAAAGGASVLMTYPLDVMRARLAVQVRVWSVEVVQELYGIIL